MQISEDIFLEIFSFFTRQHLCSLELCCEWFSRLIGVTMLNSAPFHWPNAELHVRKWKTKTNSKLENDNDEEEGIFILNKYNMYSQMEFGWSTILHRGAQIIPSFLRFHNIHILLDDQNWQEICSTLFQCSHIFLNNNNCWHSSHKSQNVDQRIADCKKMTSVWVYGFPNTPKIAWDQIIVLLGQVYMCSINIIMDSNHFDAFQNEGLQLWKLKCEKMSKLLDEDEDSKKLMLASAIRGSIKYNFLQAVGKIDSAWKQGDLTDSEHRQKYLQQFGLLNERIYRIIGCEWVKETIEKNYGPSWVKLYDRMVGNTSSVDRLNKVKIQLWRFGTNFSMMQSTIVQCVEALYKNFLSATIPLDHILELRICSFYMPEIAAIFGLEQSNGDWTFWNEKSDEYLWIFMDCDFDVKKRTFVLPPRVTLTLSYQGRMFVQRGRIGKYMRGFSFIYGSPVKDEYNEYHDWKKINQIFQCNYDGNDLEYL